MIEEQSIVKVAMADLNVAGPNGILRTTGLGSCVGLTLYDPVTKIGGMAHVMLPSSAIAREGAKPGQIRRYGSSDPVESDEEFGCVSGVW